MMVELPRKNCNYSKLTEFIQFPHYPYPNPRLYSQVLKVFAKNATFYPKKDSIPQS
jgi:hypothetical protein